MARSLVSDEAEMSLGLSAVKEAEAAYNVFVTVIADFKNNRYQAWVDHLNTLIEKDPLPSRLDVPLLRRVTAEFNQVQTQMQ
ncbi:unnamed protein product, partial [Choristocarpus tenellus]